MIKQELLNVFQVLFRKILPGILIMLFLVEDAIPLGLGFGHWGDFATFATTTMTGFTGLLEEVLAFARVASFRSYG